MPPSNDSTDINAIADWFENRPINKANREELASSILARLDFVGVEWARSDSDNVKMLDYACGPGFLSRIFAPYVSSITAIDASDVMIDKYKSNMDLLGVQHGNTHAVVGDLLSDLPKPRALADAQYHGFDLITVGAALHHFPNTENAVERLAERLRPGGVLYIQDKFDDGNRGASVSQGPRGFTKEGLEDIMSSAGLVGFGFEVLPNKVDVELLDEKVVSIQCFIGRAVKPIEG